MRDVAHFDKCPFDAFEVYRKAALKLIDTRAKILRQRACAGYARHTRRGSSGPILPRTHGEQIKKKAI